LAFGRFAPTTRRQGRCAHARLGQKLRFVLD
jgi:hypothetical protein